MFVFTYSDCCSVFLRNANKGTQQGSISSTFYARVFLYKNALCSFSLLHFGFVIFLAKECWQKSAHKMLKKLTTNGSIFWNSKNLIKFRITHLDNTLYFFEDDWFTKFKEYFCKNVLSWKYQFQKKTRRAISGSFEPEKSLISNTVSSNAENE